MKLTIPQWYGLLFIESGRWREVRVDVLERLIDKGLVERKWTDKTFCLTEAGKNLSNVGSYYEVCAALKDADQC